VARRPPGFCGLLPSDHSALRYMTSGKSRAAVCKCERMPNTARSPTDATTHKTVDPSLEVQQPPARARRCDLSPVPSSCSAARVLRHTASAGGRASCTARRNRVRLRDKHRDGNGNATRSWAARSLCRAVIDCRPPCTQGCVIPR
jgi:hypothetical protein